MIPDPSIFLALKANQPFPVFASTKEAYFYVKAHKLVAPSHFYQYWNDGRSKQPLTDILNDHYPPLEYCHDQPKGYPGLDAYVTLANEAFNDSQTSNPSN